jgi:tetratricopeptide (TPR) repeat protein
MNFSRGPFIWLSLFFSLGWFLGLGPIACQRQTTAEEKALRNELRTRLRGRQFEKAVPLAQRVLQFAPHDDGAWARLAQAQKGKHDFAGLEETLRDWRQAVRRTSLKYQEYRGDLAFARGRAAEALSAWSRTIADGKHNRRVLEKIARLEQSQGNWQEAALAWTQVMSSKESPRERINRSTCYRHLHSWEAAQDDLHRAQQLAPNAPFVRQEVERFDRLGKFLDEVRDLDRQLIALPNDAELFADRALLFLRAGDPALALDDTARAARLAPNAIRPKLFSLLARQMLGDPPPSPDLLRLELLSPEFLQTIGRLDAEISAEPQSPDLRVSRAWQLNEIGQPQLALADAQVALANDPKSAAAEAEAGYALAKLKQRAEGYVRIKRATDLDADFSTAWQYRGELEMQRGEYRAAIESLSRALAINQTAAALAKREECYRKLGLVAKAEDDRKALEQFAPPPGTNH